MAIYLHDKYADKIGQKFVADSFVKGRFSNKYNFNGVKTVKVMTPVTVPLTPYQRSGLNRYGNPQDMQDTVQEMTITQDMGFDLIIDKGDNMEQHNLKAAGEMLKLEIEQQCVPMMDKYALETIAKKAGIIVGSATALTKSNVIDRVTDGSVYLDNKEIPSGDRTLFVPAKVHKLLRLAPEWIGVEALGKQALAKGQVGEYDGMTVVKVPEGRWPKDLNFLIVHKNSAMVAERMRETKLHIDPPGISGDRLEGRFIYDAFVFEPSANGVYADLNTASGAATQVAAPTIAAATGAITGASGATVYYTTDGSDPRYSASAKAGAVADVTTAGTVVKAYAVKEGSWPSAVTTVTLTA